MFLCPICQCETLLCSSLYLKCMKCEYKHDSEKVGGSFEMNQRIVHSMLSLGKGFTSVEKINELTIIPPPITKNNYETLANKVASFTRAVAEETMRDPATEIHNTSNTNNSATVVDNSVSCDGRRNNEETIRDPAIEIHNTSKTNNSATVVDTSVSCDGIWHGRGFSSNNDVFNAISLDNGKFLDVEPMSKFCKGCIMKNNLKQKDPSAHAQQRNLRL